LFTLFQSVAGSTELTKQKLCTAKFQKWAVQKAAEKELRGRSSDGLARLMPSPNNRHHRLGSTGVDLLSSEAVAVIHHCFLVYVDHARTAAPGQPHQPSHLNCVIAIAGTYRKKQRPGEPETSQTLSQKYFSFWPQKMPAATLSNCGGSS
jgi:hypothetical protein